MVEKRAPRTAQGGGGDRGEEPLFKVVGGNLFSLG